MTRTLPHADAEARPASASGRPPDVFFQGDGLVSPMQQHQRAAAAAAKTPVARVVGGDGGDLELGTVALSPGRSPVMGMCVTSPSQRIAVAVVESLSQSMSNASEYVQDNTELSFGLCGFCSLLIILICLLLLARQIVNAV
mmetsp:Transcript_18962/g.58457  ORF Transcript_18962/g.58457 Transcript_18962/m.58457 type:complete len:141 (+) Transcript_18962:88-510(+)